MHFWKINSLFLSFLFIYQVRKGTCASTNKDTLNQNTGKSPQSPGINSSDDLETSESVVEDIYQPLTSRSTVEAELRRLKSLGDVLPPTNLSFYKPYADRTVALLKFPVISPNDFVFSTEDKNGQSPMTNCTYSLLHDHYLHYHYGPPTDPYGSHHDHYGSPDPAYGPLPLKVRKLLKYGRIPNPVTGEERNEVKPPPDVGVIVAQSYSLRENVRDYLNLTGFTAGKPSTTLLSEMASALGKKHVESNSKLHPPLNPYFDLYTRGHQPTQGPSFVLVHLETYLKTSNDSKRFGFVTAKSYSNGTIYFPRERNPELMTTVPFVLKRNGEIDYIFESEGQPADFGTLFKAKSEIRSFIQAVSGVHEEVHRDGRNALERMIKLSEGLDKPRFVNTTADEPEMARREEEARLNNWLYTSSIGIRSITYPKFVLRKEIVLVSPLFKLNPLLPHDVHYLPHDFHHLPHPPGQPPPHIGVELGEANGGPVLEPPPPPQSVQTPHL